MNETIFWLNKMFFRWWFRIIIFVFLSIVIFFVESLFFTFTRNPAPIVFALLASSIIIELLRPGGNWFTFGIKFDRFFFRDILLGLCIVAGSFIVVVGAGYIAGLQLEISDTPTFDAIQYFTMLIFFSAVSEELLYRGIIFQALIEKFNPITIVIISSILFSIVHTFNPNISFIAYINIFLANVVMSLMYIQTRSLWMPISFHFFWNWGQQLFLGSNISGIDFGITWIDLNITSLPKGLSWLFGYEFGIEEGILTTVILIAAIPIVLKIAKASPFMSAILFKRSYEESRVIHENK